MDANQRTIVVMGATGRQGGAVLRHLLKDGWRVRGVTRDPQSARAKTLAGLGAEVVQADMEDRAGLERAFAGAYGVYSVQNPYISGPEAEVRQGRHVIEAARATGVQHVVYGSAGTGKPGTGVPSWETKVQIEAALRESGLPYTILRPMAFMELMTDKTLYPGLAAWHVMPALMGSARPVVWLCTDDLGAIAAIAFSRPADFAGRELDLASDERSIDQCRSLYRAVLGRKPPRVPLPVPLFARFGFVGRDLTTMYRWLRTADLDVDVETTRSILPGALSVEQWLRRQRAEVAA